LAENILTQKTKKHFLLKIQVKHNFWPINHFCPKETFFGRKKPFWPKKDFWSQEIIYEEPKIQALMCGWFWLHVGGWELIATFERQFRI